MTTSCDCQAVLKNEQNVCDTDPVRPGEFWLFDLEIDESRQGDGIEKPGSETDNSNKDVRQTQTDPMFFQKK